MPDIEYSDENLILLLILSFIISGGIGLIFTWALLRLFSLA